MSKLKLVDAAGMPLSGIDPQILTPKHVQAMEARADPFQALADAVRVLHRNAALLNDKIVLLGRQLEQVADAAQPWYRAAMLGAFRVLAVHAETGEIRLSNLLVQRDENRNIVATAVVFEFAGVIYPDSHLPDGWEIADIDGTRWQWDRALSATFRGGRLVVEPCYGNESALMPVVEFGDEFSCDFKFDIQHFERKGGTLVQRETDPEWWLDYDREKSRLFNPEQPQN